MKTERRCDICGEPMGDDVGFAHRHCWDRENFLSQVSGCDTIEASSEEGIAHAPCDEASDAALCHR
jgi:hypothetical protein